MHWGNENFVLEIPFDFVGASSNMPSFSKMPQNAKLLIEVLSL